MAQDQATKRTPDGQAGAARASERLAFAGASATALLGGFGLLGWLTPWWGLASLYPGSIPMAPTTALVLVLLGSAVMRDARRPSLRLTTAVSLLVLVFGGLRLARFAAGRPLALDALILDALLVGHPAMFRGVPTGRISPLTGIGLLSASLSLLLLGLARRRRALGVAGAILALGVHLLGIVVALGYLFGAPLLYGGTVVPMAFSTALAVGCLGLALLALTPRDSVPLRPFLGPSARARLLRALLPVPPIVVAGDLLLAQVAGFNPALRVALTALLSALLVAAVVAYAAHSVGRDLDRTEAERERSRRDADRLAAIVQSSSDAIYATNLDQTTVAWNPSAARLFGYSQVEALGRSARILVPLGAEEELARISETIGGAGGVADNETHRVRKDGTSVLVSLSESPLHDAEGQVVGVSVIARDVSERRRAETALRQSAAEFRLLAEAMPQIVWITRPDGWNVYFNQQWMDYTGLTLEQSLGHGWNRPFHPEDQQRASDAWQRATATVDTYSLECRLRRADGIYRWWLIRGVPVRDASGNVSKWFGTCTDIHDLKLAQLEVARSEDRFSRVFQSNLVAIGFATMSSGRLVDMNPRWLEYFGYTRDEVIGRTVAELGLWVDLADRERHIAAIGAGHAISQGEVSFRAKSGAIRQAMVAMEAVTLAGETEPLVMVSMVDLTGHKQLEAQLLQAQKMEAVGRLAGGVAHDFNNSLGVILGYTELLMRKAEEPARSKLEQILKATQHASGLTRQLLAFSRKEIAIPKVLDLNALLSDLEKMLGRLIGEDVDLAIVPGPDLGQVKADPGQLEQVVMNLCVNAKDAMRDGGLLRIETANAELDRGQLAGHEPMPPGPYVMLAVSDTGCGIEKENRLRIFDPFFTTKEQGKGTGLGLAMVYGIVKQAGGCVWVYSEPGQGATFKIYLPRIDEGVVSAAVETPMPSRGWETILLVEDEGSLRAIAREILEEHGYRVIEAVSPSEAIAIAQRHPGLIHLLFTDVVMPGMGGRALAEALVAKRPSLRVLYMSGYTDDVIAHRGMLEPGALLLAKPFTARALLGRVREALGERGAGDKS